MYTEGLENETIDDDDVFTAPGDQSVRPIDRHQFHTNTCSTCRRILLKNHMEQEQQRERYKRQKEAEASLSKSGLPGYTPDAFIKSPLVGALNKDNYDKFIKQFDLSLVFFYDPRNANSRRPAVEMKKAAEATKRDKHAYGAVNCNVEKAICEKQNVSSIPFFRFFWKGDEMNTVTQLNRLNAANMQKIMESSKRDNN